jgi:hypothetical protein
MKLKHNMPVLANARHEQFAQLVASGIKPIEAYTSLGYSKANAAFSASRLSKNVKVCARIAELQAAAAQASVQGVVCNQQRVLARLDMLGRQAEQDQKLAAAIRCEELIGRHLGMFIDRTDVSFKWSGRLEDLSDDQLEQLEKSLAARYAFPPQEPEQTQ